MFSDIHQIQQALENYYEKKQGIEDVKISDLSYIKEGISHYMYSFCLKWVKGTAKESRNLILRCSKDKDELHKEFQALNKLHFSSIPVPRVYDIGEDMLDFSFIIMEKVKGQNMDKAQHTMKEAEQAKLWKQFAELLADIHMLNWKNKSFSFLNPPEDRYEFVRQGLLGLKQGCKETEIYSLNPVLDWLEENKPRSDRYVLLHGDYLPGNIIVHKKEIKAVVDWEGVSIGDAAYDVCWPVLLFRLVDPSEERSDSLTEDFLKHYQNKTGEEIKNLFFYQIFKVSFLLFITLSIKKHGAQKLQAKKEAEGLSDPEFDLPGRCSEFIRQKTGITLQV